MGPTTPLSPTATAMDFFGQNFDDDLFRHIVDETNLYASQMGSKWRWPLTVDELKAFLKVWTVMGIVKLPRVRDYWSQERIYGEHSVITGAFAGFRDYREFQLKGKKGRPRYSAEVVPAVFDRQHYPMEFPSEGQCVVCKYRVPHRKRTKFGCGLCGDKRMCPVPCFEIHHTQ